MDLYRYNAFITAVYDGDTVTADIDLGFGIIMHKQKIRLSYINTPEIRGVEREAGLVSRFVLREKVLDKNVIIETQKDKSGKYGRLLGTIYVPYTIITETEGESGFINVNKWLVENNYAVKYGDKWYKEFNT